ncbi:MAG: diguanylate cyclase [Alcaligenaceae bacterium]|nr:diguanylate cyclase [Alcaligenaceae bacterium]
MSVEKAAPITTAAALAPEGVSARHYWGLLLAVFLFSLVGIYLRPLDGLSALWPANALLLGLFLRLPRLATPLGWCVAATGYVLADLLTGNSLSMALFLNSTNLLGVAIALAVCGRSPIAEQRLKGPGGLSTLFLAIVAASLVAGIVGGGLLWLLLERPLGLSSTNWVASELLSYIIFLPCILSAPNPRAWRWRERRVVRRKRIPLALLFVSLLASVFIGGPGALAFPVIALLACALSYGMFATSLLTLAASLWTLIVTASGNILSIADAGDTYALLSIRLGVASIALAPIVVACVMTAREHSLKALRHMAEHDTLTDLLNRRTFHQRAQEKLSQLKGQEKSVAILMIDLDHFKNINDTYGHAAGDEVLRITAKRLRKTIRSDDLCARVGGEEFLVLIAECTPELLEHITQRLHKAIGQDILLPNTQQSLNITASIGATLSDLASPHLEDMVLQADQALYSAKEKGRNRTNFASMF